MVAQCASLVHKVVIAGWELLQFPWVRAIAGKFEVISCSELYDDVSYFLLSMLL